MRSVQSSKGNNFPRKTKYARNKTFNNLGSFVKGFVTDVTRLNARYVLY